MKSICIVGAGLTGIQLAKKIPGSIILEKSRGVGGRLAARRLGDFSINHGPQNILLDSTNLPILNPHEWIKQESEGLGIQKTFEVSKLEQLEDIIRVTAVTGESIECQKVILTIPAPQALIILKRSDLEAEFLQPVTYKSAIQFMVLGRNLDLRNLQIDFTQVESRPVTSDLNLYLFSMKGPFLEEFLERERDEIKDFCLQKVSGDIIDAHVHKWRYSEVLTAINPEFQLKLMNKNIFLAGDYFGLDGVKSSLASVRKIMPHI